MRYYFTKRHAADLKEKRLVPYLPVKLRVSLRRKLYEYCVWGGEFGEDNYTFGEVEEILKTFYGEEELLAYNSEGKLVPTHLDGLIDKGFPARVLDLLEIFCERIENASKCEKELNTIFEIHNSPWRIVNATVYLIDSEYLHNEVIARTQNLMRENAVAGALEEFTEAVSALTGGRTKDAVVYAHKSVESVMKTCLETEEHLTFGGLLKITIKSGLIPEYYDEFLVHFEKLALGAVKERNRPGAGHGQGQEPTEVPNNLAEFVVHLAGSLNLFLLKKWLESKPSQEEIVEDEEVPF